MDAGLRVRVRPERYWCRIRDSLVEVDSKCEVSGNDGETGSEERRYIGQIKQTLKKEVSSFVEPLKIVRKLVMSD